MPAIQMNTVKRKKMSWHLDMSAKINSQVFMKLILKARGMKRVIYGP